MNILCVDTGNLSSVGAAPYYVHSMRYEILGKGKPAANENEMAFQLFKRIRRV